MAGMSVLRNLLDAGHGVAMGNKVDDHFLLISDVAEKVDMEPKTIRFYEKMGLLKPRRLGQLRVFVDLDIEVLLLIKTLRQYGMSIPQVREALTLHHQQDDFSDTRIKTLLAVQLALLTDKHRELTKQIAVLDNTLSQQFRKLVA